MRIVIPLLVLLLILPMSQAQSLGETLQECPSTLTGSTQPEQIHLQTTEDATEMTVVWATDRRTDAVVEWNGQSAEGQSYCYNHDMAFHLAIMDGLVAGEEVTYRVGDGNTWSDEFTFNVIDPNADTFEWIAIADHGLSDEAQEVSDAILADSTVQMVTISGDISYANGDQSVWDEYFDVQEASMTQIPWMTSVGNHENEPGVEFEAFEHRFDADNIVESEPFWYSRNVPGVHMVFMSTEHPFESGSEQFNWLKSDLQSVNRQTQPFIVVMGHKPMYSSNSYHGSEIDLRNALEALYVEQGVDLVIAGHDHFYERTWPVIDEMAMAKGVENRFSRGDGPIHLVIGIGGRDSYEELDEPQPEWSAYRENSSYGWTKLIYDGVNRELSFTHYRIDATIGDQFVLTEKVQSTEDEAGFIPAFEAFFSIIALFWAAIYRQR